jgi:hypothetical protein
MMKLPPTTPQEIADYKRKWMSETAYEVQVDMDSDIWGKDWCRKNMERMDWSFEKHTRPDDSHTFFFKDEDIAERFLDEYRYRNPRFPTEVL